MVYDPPVTRTAVFNSVSTVPVAEVFVKQGECKTPDFEESLKANGL